MSEPTKKTVRKFESEDLIEWLALLAYEAKKDWGFIKTELLRRLRKKNG
jgi:hypothetical protein